MAVMLSTEVEMDYRRSIRDRLSEKKSELVSTESSLKKYVGDLRRRRPLQGRLGPSVGRRVPAGLRLGPKVASPEKLESGDEEFLLPLKKSRVIVVQENVLSRDEALAQKKDAREIQRNKRMFGSLMGTLQKFKREETRITSSNRNAKKREVEKKIEERSEKEKEEAIRCKAELLAERSRQQKEIRLLQVQMKRVEEFEIWENSKRKQMSFIRTKTEPPLFYLPKEHNEKSMTALEETMDAIEEEIKTTKARFEEDLIKMEQRLDEEEGSMSEEEEFTEKPKSIISKPSASENNGSNAEVNGKKVVEEEKTIKIIVENYDESQVSEMEDPPVKVERDVDNKTEIKSKGNHSEENELLHHPKNNVDVEVLSQDEGKEATPLILVSESLEKENDFHISNKNEGHRKDQKPLPEAEVKETKKEVGVKVESLKEQLNLEKKESKKLSSGKKRSSSYTRRSSKNSKRVKPRGRSNSSTSYTSTSSSSSSSSSSSYSSDSSSSDDDEKNRRCKKSSKKSSIAKKSRRRSKSSR